MGGQAWPACPTRRGGSPHCPGIWVPFQASLALLLGSGHQSSRAKLAAGHPGEEWVLSLGCCDHPGLRKTSEPWLDALLSILTSSGPLAMAPSSARVFFVKKQMDEGPAGLRRADRCGEPRVASPAHADLSRRRTVPLGGHTGGRDVLQE